MNSIEFPKMFSTTSTNIVTDLKATKQNLILLLLSEKLEFKYDPYFGIKLKGFMFDPNNYVLKYLLIDEVYTQIALFIPQLKVQRRDITITTDRAKVYCRIVGINQLDFTTNTYNLVLYEEENK